MNNTESSYNSFADSCGVIETVLRRDDMPVKQRYGLLHDLFMAVQNERTADSTLVFANPFARLEYLCGKAGCCEEDRRRINDFRARCNRLDEIKEDDLDELLGYDAKALTRFLALIYNQSVPASLISILPDAWLSRSMGTVESQCLRVSVVSISDDCIETVSVADGSTPIRVVIGEKEHFFGDFLYLKQIVKKESQLNLIRPRSDDSGKLHPELIVFEPDYLMDVSAVASCFEQYGPSPYIYLLKLFEKIEPSHAILLGNYASALMDNEIQHMGTANTSGEVWRQYVVDNSLAMITCSDFDQKKMLSEGEEQRKNIQALLHTAISEVKDFDKSKVLIEPSFISEILGLQGRMDFLQDNLRVLIEQKSGKRDYYSNGHVKKHYVQILLYQALLHYQFNLNNSEIGSYLLYSKFQDGLIKEGPAPKLLYEAMQMRNQMVWLSIFLSEGGARKLFETLTPEKFRVGKVSEVFWQKYCLKGIQALFDTVNNATEVEKAYFFRFLTFVAKEHRLAKVGSGAKECSGFASLWNASLSEKLSAGTILHDMTISPSTWNNLGNDGKVSSVMFIVADSDNDYLPNIRKGDIVVAYPYKAGSEPDARATMIMRGSVADISPTEVVVELRSPQKNKAVFHLEEPDMRWAIEPDFMESSFKGLYLSLLRLLSANTERKKLLLGQMSPHIDSTVTVKGDYGPHQDLVEKAMQARDYFILVGPPGTGKTSFGMMSILLETLEYTDDSVLLLSFTNRAVDEMCSKLVAHGIQFMRLGRHNSCPEVYHPYLLSETALECNGDLDLLKRQILECRVIVATTTTMISQQMLFLMKRFQLAIVDEASQILEPQIIGLLCAKDSYGNNAIDRFVLIGDHKQLPAVVMQSQQDTVVTDQLLSSIGVTDCRNSLFERLLKINCDNTPFVHHLVRQGRMHEDVAVFPSRQFYAGQLKPVPLPHQIGPLPDCDDSTDNKGGILNNRLAFLPVIPRDDDSLLVSSKTNIAEAETIARIVADIVRRSDYLGETYNPVSLVGIIVPYRHQIAMVRREMARLKIPRYREITIDTVERFQGSERDVIVYGFTIRKAWQLAFLTATRFMEDGQIIDRKLNVALTRARKQLFIVGNPDLLRLDPLYSLLLDYTVSYDTEKNDN